MPIPQLRSTMSIVVKTKTVSEVSVYFLSYNLSRETIIKDVENAITKLKIIPTSRILSTISIYYCLKVNKLKLDKFKHILGIL